MSSRVADDKDDEDEEDASVLIISATGLLRTSFSLKKKTGEKKGNAESRPPAGTNVNALITDIRETTNTHT